MSSLLLDVFDLTPVQQPAGSSPVIPLTPTTRSTAARTALIKTQYDLWKEYGHAGPNTDGILTQSEKNIVFDVTGLDSVEAIEATDRQACVRTIGDKKYLRVLAAAEADPHETLADMAESAKQALKDSARKSTTAMRCQILFTTITFVTSAVGVGLVIFLHYYLR